MDELYELKEKLCKELKRYNNESVSNSNVDAIKKLSASVHYLDEIIEKYEETEGYSGRYSNRYDERGMSNGYSNANRRRDSRGRYSRGYSRDGYSYGGVEELREIMEDMPESVKGDIQRVIRKMESM